MANDYSINAKITADASGFKKGVDTALKSTKSFTNTIGDTIKNLGSGKGLIGTLGSVGVTLGAVGIALGTAKKAFQAVAKVVGECTEAYKKQHIAEEQLRQAVNNSNAVTSESTKVLLDYASAIQKTSNYGDEELIPMMTKLIASGRSEADAMKIMQTAVDMASTGTISLDTAVTQLNQTLNGSAGRLAQQNAELKGLTEEELKSGKAVDILASKYDGMAKKSIDSTKQLKNAWGDYKESLGKGFEEALSPMRNYFAQLIQGWADARKAKQAYDEAVKNVEKGAEASGEDLQTVIDYNENLIKRWDEAAEALAKEYGKSVEYVKDNFYAMAKFNDEYADLLKYNRTEISDLRQTNKILKNNLEIRRQQEQQAKETAQAEADANAKEQARIDRWNEKNQKASDLIEAYNDKIAKQNIIWEQNARIKGETVSLEEKYKFYQDALINTMSEANGLITENNQFYKEQLKIIQDMGKELPPAVKKLDNMVDKGEELAKVAKTQLKSAFTDVFKKIGSSLVEGQASFDDYASAGVSAIANILEALAEQLTAQIAVNLATGNFAQAGIAAAGAAAALVSAGALSAVANKMSVVAETTYDAGTAIEKFKESLNSIQETRFSKSGTITLGLQEMGDRLDDLRIKQKALEDTYGAVLDKPEQAIKMLSGMSGALGEVAEKYYEYKETLQLIAEAEKTLNEALKNVSDTLKNSVKENRNVINSYKDFYGATVLIADSAEYQFKKYSTYLEMIKEEQKIGLQELEADVYETFQSFGKNIGEAMFKSFSDGSGKESFFNDMKGMIRETVLKMAVYTESFTERLSEVGAKLVSALMGGEDLEEVTKTISDIYDDVARVAEGLENKLDGIFGKIEEEMGFIVSNFAKNMKSFKETIKDVTGDIGTTFINGLTEGITQGDFLGNIKDWLRKMMIQMVVYTDTMKAEIEEIGKRISAGITEGFTDTDLHEIRRDMSYMFEEATRKVSSIDSILGGVFGGYATGTNNARRGLHLVGEAGPELVRFGGGEKVMNNRATNKALASGISGSTNNFNVTFNNTQDTTAFAMMSQLKQYNRQMAINGVI